MDDAPPVPTDAQRLAACERPAGRAIMYQQWQALLFAHWRYPARAIQATLPPGLFVDTHEGHAYLGVVPFAMRRVRPRGLPAVPGLSSFLELNLRTYVYDRAGVPGVWFYSLDANQWLAVVLAQRFFHLPYRHARMSAHRAPDGRMHFRSERRHPPVAVAPTVLSYAAIGAPRRASTGSLDFFLAERYRLYASRPSGLYRGAVWHTPYPLAAADVFAVDETVLTLNAFTPTGRHPDHVCFSPGVDVTIFPMERVPVG